MESSSCSRQQAVRIWHEHGEEELEPSHVEEEEEAHLQDHAVEIHSEVETDDDEARDSVAPLQSKLTGTPSFNSLTTAATTSPPTAVGSKVSVGPITSQIDALSSTDLQLQEWNIMPVQHFPIGRQEPPLHFLSALPTDVIYTVLLMLDGAALASVSATSVALSRLSRGEELEPLWRHIALNDVTRLSYPERKFMQQAHAAHSSELTSLTHSHQQGDSSTNLSHHLSPRVVYLQRLKARWASRASISLEIARKLDERNTRQVRIRTEATREVMVESMFLVGVPFLLLASSIALLISPTLSDSYSVWTDSATAWIVFGPMWLCIVLAMITLAWMSFSKWRRFERRRARLLLEKKAATTTTALAVVPASPTSGNLNHVAQAQVTAAANANNSNSSEAPSPSSAAVSNASGAAAAASSSSSSSAANRERANNRFLALSAARRQATENANSKEAAGEMHTSHMEEELLLDSNKGQGFLQAILESHRDLTSAGYQFDKVAVACTGIKCLFVLLSSVLLFVKLSLSDDSISSDLTYIRVFSPIFAVILWSFCSIFFELAASMPHIHVGNMQFRYAWRRFSEAIAQWFYPQYYFNHSPQASIVILLLKWTAWVAPPALSLLLISLHLDGCCVYSLSNALVPLYIYEGILSFVLVLLSIQFGYGVRIGWERRHRTWSQDERSGTFTATTARGDGTPVSVLSNSAVAAPSAALAGNGEVLIPSALHPISNGNNNQSFVPSAAAAQPVSSSPPLLQYSYHLRFDPMDRFPRLSLTFFVLALVMVSMIVFEHLLYLRSHELQHMHQRVAAFVESDLKWSMQLVSIPLVIAMAMSVLLSIASACDMVQQRSKSIEEAFANAH